MPKLLFVDDELNLRNLCYDFFTKEGYNVITASRTDQAMTMSRLEKPDLIVLDLQMPGENGLVFLKKMKAERSPIPTMVFSTYISPEIEKEAYEAGAVELVTKGIKMNELRDKIQKVLGAKERLLSAKEASAQKETILVVDDEEPIRKLLLDFFGRKGYRMLGAKNGEEALHQVRTEKPFVILLDVKMPGMDGILTLKKIREIDPEVGVVMTTSVQDEEIAREATALGAYHYVLKPFDLKYLELVVYTRLVIAA